MELKRLVTDSPVVNAIFAVALSYYLFSGNSPEPDSAQIEIAPDAYLYSVDLNDPSQSILNYSSDVSEELTQINFESQAVEQDIRRLLSDG